MSDLSISGASAQPIAKPGTPEARPEVRMSTPLKSPEVPELPEIELEETISKIKEAIEVLNEALATKDRSIRFRIDETIDRAIITVVDEGTGKVIRQLPSEEMLKVAYNIEDMKGILLEEWI